MTVTERIAAGKLIAVIRLPDLREGARIAEVLISAGIDTLEFTLDSAGAPDVISSTRERFGEEALVGAGTVLSAKDVDKAVESGAQFCVSPHLDPELLARAATAGVPSLPGVFTMTEVLAAQDAGASMVKMFPAQPPGPGYLQTIRGPLPSVAIVPTGGIRVEDVPAFLAAGAAAVGLGSALVRADQDWDGLEERAVLAAALARGDR